MVIWDSNFEVGPPGSDNPRFGPSILRDIKIGVRERLETEHNFTLVDNDPDDDGWHKPGATRAYVGEKAPTVRPDGTTLLDGDDKGRQWFKPSTGGLYFWNGSEWKPLLEETVGKAAGDLYSFVTLDVTTLPLKGTAYTLDMLTMKLNERRIVFVTGVVPTDASSGSARTVNVKLPSQGKYAYLSLYGANGSTTPAFYGIVGESQILNAGVTVPVTGVTPSKGNKLTWSAEFIRTS